MSNSDTTSPKIQTRQAAWSVQGIGKQWQQRFFYWLIRLLGKRPAYHISYIVTFWYVLFYPSIRRRCSFYLRRRFPQHRNIIRRFLDTYHLVRTFGVTLVDMTAFEILGRRSLTVLSPDHDRIIAFSAASPGFVLLNAHVGCWQLGISSLGTIPKTISLVTLPQRQTEAVAHDQITNQIDPTTGLDGVLQMTQTLLAGGIVVMMGDRTFGDAKNTVTANFLGAPAAFPLTPYRLASATGLPVLILTAPRTGPREYEIRLTKVIEVAPNLGRNPQAYTPYAQQFADCLAEFVHDHPWQFFNFFDLWHDPASTNATAEPPRKIR
jgi:predicted LPLAT superfamily acyltransferase